MKDWSIKWFFRSAPEDGYDSANIGARLSKAEIRDRIFYDKRSFTFIFFVNDEGSVMNE